MKTNISTTQNFRICPYTLIDRVAHSDVGCSRKPLRAHIAIAAREVTDLFAFSAIVARKQVRCSREACI